MPRELRAGEPVVTPRLVRGLLAAQHPDLAGLPVGEAVRPASDAGTLRGWDNTMVRLGEHLAVRLPRHDAGQGLLDREVAWLPRIAELTGLGVPAPVRSGVPGDGFPYRWAVVPWAAGTAAASRSAGTRDAYAVALAGQLRRLHVPAPPEAPDNPYRGTPLEGVAGRFLPRWRALRDQLPSALARAVEAAWQDALAAPGHRGPAVWLHGDPHPDNTVLGEDAAAPTLVDFGDLCAGDPASDLGIALTHFTPAGGAVFRAAYDAGRAPDRDLWRRARGWSLVIATILAAQPADDPLHGVGWDVLGHYRP